MRIAVNNSAELNRRRIIVYHTCRCHCWPLKGRLWDTHCFLARQNEWLSFCSCVGIRGGLWRQRIEYGPLQVHNLGKCRPMHVERHTLVVTLGLGGEINSNGPSLWVREDVLPFQIQGMSILHPSVPGETKQNKVKGRNVETWSCDIWVK